MTTKKLEEHTLCLLQKIIQFPLIRIIIAFVLVFGAVIAVQLVMKPLGRFFFATNDLPEFWLIIMWMLAMLLAVFVYSIYVRFIEKRSVNELARNGAFSEFGIGCAIGAGLMISVVTILWGFSYYQVVGVSSLGVIIFPFFDGIFTGVFEEILFRGILFRIIEKSLGSWIAIVLSGLLFGFAHAAEPNATLLSSFAIAFLGGTLFSAAYMLTRKLWIVIGMHFAWNFFQGGIFSVAVSGKEAEGLLQAQITGPEFITGGSFGVEASIITILLGLMLSIYLLWKVYEKRNFIQPFWKH